MSSINDSLSLDLLFNIFKQLDCIQTTRIRRVCKQWFEVIEVHKSFWRTLHLPEKSVQWSPSILELFDHKSGSTLQDVGVKVPVEGELQEQFFDTLKKSEKSLEHLFVNFPWHQKRDSQRRDFLEAFPHVKSLMVLHWYESSKVRLRRRVVQDPDAASALKVLWYNPTRTLLEFDQMRFRNLVSLETGDDLSPSQWRTFLQGPSKTLKHLRTDFSAEVESDQDTIPTLELPNLMVLDLDDINLDFPQWLVVPESVKLLIRWECSNLPPASELWLWYFRGHEDEVSYRCPRLKTVLLIEPDLDQDGFLEALTRRKLNVEAGLEVDGVKMEMIKKLILPSKLGAYSHSEDTKNFVERCRELVEVVEGGAESRFIEIEV